MNYEQHILRILSEAGEDGLSVAKIARHVHHACNTLFSPISYVEVHRDVAQFLLRNSKNPDSIIEKTDRGIYHLNMRSTETQQLMLQFQDERQDTDTQQPSVDLSLSLF